MLAKMFANGLVILVAAMLSLQFVVHLWIGAPIAGSMLLFLFGAAHLCSRGGGAWHSARYALDDHGPVRIAGDAGSDGHAIAFGQQHANGEHAGLAAIRHADDQPDAAFRCLRSGRAFPWRRLTLVWRPLVAMLVIGSVYFAFALSRFRRVIFGS